MLEKLKTWSQKVVRNQEELGNSKMQLSRLRNNLGRAHWTSTTAARLLMPTAMVPGHCPIKTSSVISSSLPHLSWVLRLKPGHPAGGPTGMMGPSGFRSEQPSSASAQSLSVAQFGVRKSCTQFKEGCMRIRKMAWLMQVMLQGMEETDSSWKEHVRLKDKASQERTSGKSAAVKVWKEKDHSMTHRKKIRFITGVSCSSLFCGFVVVWFFFLATAPGRLHSSWCSPIDIYLKFKSFTYLDSMWGCFHI